MKINLSNSEFHDSNLHHDSNQQPSMGEMSYKNKYPNDMRIKES